MTVRLSAAEFREQAKAAPARKAKYRNVPTVVDGIRFASKAEAKYYLGLKQREKNGEVYEVEMQRRFALTIAGVLICTYVSDFSFYDATAKRNRVIDVKGMETPEFKLKKKLMRAVLGIEVETVK